MDLLRDGLDLKLVDDGVWRYYDDETSFKICKWQNAEYQAALRKALSPHKQGIRVAKMSEKRLIETERKVMAKTILVGWKNLTDGDKEVPYSVEKAYELLSDPRYSEIEMFVREIALTEANYRREELNEAMGK